MTMPKATLEVAQEKDKENARTYSAMSFNSYHKADFAGMEKWAREAYLRQRDDVETIIQLGRALMLNSTYPEAESLFKQALALSE